MKEEKERERERENENEKAANKACRCYIFNLKKKIRNLNSN